MTRHYHAFIKTFSRAVTILLSMLGWAFVLAAFCVALFPNDGLRTEAPIPLYVIISMWWVGIGMFYLWFSERLRRV